MKTKAAAKRQYRKIVGTVPGYVYKLPSGMWRWCTADSGTAINLTHGLPLFPITERIMAVEYEAI